MQRLVLIVATIFLGFSTTFAQTQSDVCHVYVVDVAKAITGNKAYEERGDSKVLSSAQTTFPDFRPTIGEEEITVKTYRFPGRKLFITASVFYTDESMASAEGSDSMQIGVVVSRRRQADGISTENNAVAEVSLTSNRYTLRAKKYVRAGGRLYLVGIECRCNDPAASR